MSLNTRIQRRLLENITKISDGETEQSPGPCIAICILFWKRVKPTAWHDQLCGLQSMGNGWEVNWQGWEDHHEGVRVPRGRKKPDRRVKWNEHNLSGSALKCVEWGEAVISLETAWKQRARRSQRYWERIERQDGNQHQAKGRGSFKESIHFTWLAKGKYT